jgi:hypothetical protein
LWLEKLLLLLLLLFLKKVKDGKINDANCFPLVLWAWHAKKYAPKQGSITVRSRILFAVIWKNVDFIKTFPLYLTFS